MTTPARSGLSWSRELQTGPLSWAACPVLVPSTSSVYVGLWLSLLAHALLSVLTIKLIIKCKYLDLEYGVSGLSLWQKAFMVIVVTAFSTRLCPNLISDLIYKWNLLFWDLSKTMKGVWRASLQHTNTASRKVNMNVLFLFHRAFPNCKFAEKCLFIHPNCKYDAKCTKPDCPFTHMSRRIPVLSPKPGEWLCVFVPH